jgi:hypothetical protein
MFMKVEFRVKCDTKPLMCGDGRIVVMFVSCGLGILIDGPMFVLRFCLVK